MHQELTSPANLACLSPLDLRENHTARPKNSLHPQGTHRMLLKRVGKNPEYSRPYLSGDPLRLIDWKAFGRTNQLIIREQNDNTSAMIHLVNELTSTMNWPNPNEEGLPEAIPAKHELALRVALHLSHYHLRMGDRVRIWFVSDDDICSPRRAFIPTSPGAILKLFAELIQRGFDPRTLEGWCQNSAFHLQQADRIYWIGDALNETGLTKIQPLGKRGIFFHILSSLELCFDWLTDQDYYFDHGKIRKAFSGANLKGNISVQQALNSWRNNIKKSIISSDCHYQLATDQTSLGQYFHFLDLLSDPKAGRSQHQIFARKQG